MYLIAKLVIIGAIVLPLVNSGIVNAGGPSISDFPDNQEGICITFGDEPEMQALCAWINICDDTGEVNSTHKFCTGKAVRNLPYPPGGCPEGFHSTEDDEDGLCDTNVGGCVYDGLVFTNDKKSCISDDTCDSWPDTQECISKKDYCAIEDINNNWVRNYCFSGKDECIVQLNGSRCTNEDVAAQFNLTLSKIVPYTAIDCEAEPSDPLCTEKNGRDGFVFCDIRNRFPDPIYLNCVDRYPKMYCPTGYHPEKLEGIPQCISDVECDDEGQYLNIFDKCMSNAFCEENPKIFDCLPLFNYKPVALPVDCNVLPNHPFCNDTKGHDGYIWCDLKTIQHSCWENPL